MLREVGLDSTFHNRVIALVESIKVWHALVHGSGIFSGRQHSEGVPLQYEHCMGPLGRWSFAGES